MLATGGKSSVTAKTEEPPGIGDFFGGDLPGKFLTLLALLAISRVGVYIPLPGVDVERFADAIQSSGMMGMFLPLAPSVQGHASGDHWGYGCVPTAVET